VCGAIGDPSPLFPTKKKKGKIKIRYEGLEDVVFNDFIKDGFIPEAEGQVVSGSASLPDPVVVETDARKRAR